MDTVSVIYIQPTDGAALVKTGDCVGALTSEIKPGEYISEFVSGGPKNYAFKTCNTVTAMESTVCKVRGITLTASQLVNFARIKHMILKGNEQDTATVHTERKIKRKRGVGRVQIVTEPDYKTYRVSFFKRRRLQDNTSVPFEYIKPM
jgi:adenine-specific DNA methylase